MRFRRQGVEPTRRLSYCSITTPKQKLQCFSEVSSSRLGQAREFHTFSADVTNAQSPIIHLQLLVFDNAHDALTTNRLLAVHEDGEIRCFSENLQSEEWNSKIQPQSGSFRVEFASIISLEEAQQSLIKNREDILAMMGDVTGVQNVHIMLLVTRSWQMASEEGSSSLGLRICHVGASIGNRISTKELALLTLPEIDGLSSEDSKYSWHAPNGFLLQSTSTTLSVYDLSGLVPQLRHHLKLGSGSFATCLCLSPSTVALADKTSISIIDMQYHSLQGRCLLDIPPKPPNKTDKQNLKENTRNDTRLISYFAPLDLVAALRGRELVAIQLLSLKQNNSGTRKRKRDSFLIDAVGRAFSSIEEKNPEYRPSSSLPKSLGTFLPTPQSLRGWKKQKELLDSLFGQEDFDGFERIMADELGINNGVTKPTPNGLSDAEHTFEIRSPDLYKVYYVLAKIFSFERNQGSATENSAKYNTKLKVSWFPSKICHWLIRQGLFSPYQIETALKIHEALPSDEAIKFGEFTQAIVERDKTLDTLQLILSNPVPLDVHEIAHCLSHFVSLTNSVEKRDEIKLLTNGDIPAIGRLEQCRHETEISLAICSAPSYQQSDGGNTVHELLDSILTRLNTHPTSQVSEALRAVLSPVESRSLVDLLRVKMAQGQWLSSHVKTDQDHANCMFPKNSQISSIAMLLNCAIDSLGTGGWVVGASATESLAETADTVAYMKAEISAALEGIEEATYLKGMLGEILLFDKNSRTRNQNLFPMDQFVSHNRCPTADISNSGNSLPMGLRIAQFAPGKRLAAGGEIVERSQREIGMLKSKMVGKYSFDRIII